MGEHTIHITAKTLVSAAFFTIGLILVGYVAINAFYLASGMVQPLRVQFYDAATGRPLIASVESQVLIGVIVQIGMYALILVASAILLKYGRSFAKG